MGTVTGDRTLLIAIISVGLSIIGLMFHQTNSINGRINRLEQRMDTRFDHFEARIDARFDQVDARFERLESHVFQLPPLKDKN